MFRAFSVFFRNRKEQKDVDRVLKKFEHWKKRIAALPVVPPKPMTLALVRLDDIGDYLLFRNFLNDYRTSKRFEHYTITLIGNRVWKSIFEQFDRSYVDEVIWIDKQRYLADDEYRNEAWRNVRRRGFEIMINTSRTRPIILDDTMTLAIHSPERSGNSNTTRYPKWNKVSDTLYTSLYHDRFSTHEFLFNQEFSAWATHESILKPRPEFFISGGNAPVQGAIICFVGASAKSRRWDVARWIQFIKILLVHGFVPVLAGGERDVAMTDQIVAKTGVMSIAGKTSLTETFQCIEASKAVISGDTMAAHAGVSCNKPTVIISNGVNAARFVDYEGAGIRNVGVVYAKPYVRFLADKNKNPFHYFSGVTRDMKEISPQKVFDKLRQVLVNV